MQELRGRGDVVRVSVVVFVVCRGGTGDGEVEEEEDYDDGEHGPLQGNLDYPEGLHETRPLCLHHVSSTSRGQM
jgi:hypothetical protein